MPVPLDDPNFPTCVSVSQCASCDEDGVIKFKKCLRGLTLAPWVRIQFGDDTATQITVGNHSQPHGSYEWSGTQQVFTNDTCSSSIKSFQYSFGSMGQGTGCKVVILDEKSSSFTQWVNRVIRNIEAGYVNTGNPDKDKFSRYKMIAQWGWVATYSECDFGEPNYPQIISKSEKVYFVPINVTTNIQNGRFMYEIEGVDLFHIATTQEIYTVAGKDYEKMYYKDAIIKLLEDTTPHIKADFLMYNTSGVPVPMKFFVPEGATTGTNGTYDVDKGPLATWQAKGLRVNDAIRQWTMDVRADDGSVTASCDGDKKKGQGIVWSWDSKNSIPTLNFWANPLPTCDNNQTELNQVFAKRCLGTYVCNGGKCSSVISFTPKIQYNFDAAMKAGGFFDPTKGTANPNSNQLGCETSGGVVTPERVGPHNRSYTVNGANAGDVAIRNQQAFFRGQLKAFSIEAEMRIQGDPTLCSPINTIGRTIAIIYVNPFSLVENDIVNYCLEWVPRRNNRCVDIGITESICNEVLTNKGWFVLGVDHQIKEGSYVTTYKLFLAAPGGEISAKLPYGGDPCGFKPESQGTFTSQLEFGTGYPPGAAVTDDGDRWYKLADGIPQTCEDVEGE